MSALFHVARTGVTVVLSVLLVTCSPPVSVLERIQARGLIRIVTINSATTYYLGPDGPTGLAYDLARHFADRLGVELRLIVADSVEAVLPMLERGQADIAAAGLVTTPERLERVRFTPPIRYITPQLVYHRNNPEPDSLASVDGSVIVVKGSAPEEILRRVAPNYPTLNWGTSAGAATEELLYQVAEGTLEYTVASSDLVAINQRYYPPLAIAFDLGAHQAIAWALPESRDDSLYNQAIQFFIDLRRNEELKRLLDRYFGYVEHLDYVGRQIFERQIEANLPAYIDTFKAAAKKQALDWRLLAAMAYQESHMEPLAESPTGVRGLMMLTLATADFVDVENRLDPQQSIRGGARYLRYLLEQLPESIPRPDRVWMALAAYNLGPGHVLDARRLVKKRGGDPDRWVDLRGVLPLLTRKEWYSQTRYGYARGNEAVTYVGNIRSYYDILSWLTEQKEPEPEPPPPDIEDSTRVAADGLDTPAPHKPETPVANAGDNPINEALEIDSPAL